MTNESPETNAELLGRLAALEERVAALETGTRKAATVEPGNSAGHAREEDRFAPDRLWAVDALRSRSGPPFEERDSRGSLLYAGSLTTRGTGTLAWQLERPLPFVLQRDWAGAAHLLTALAHPVKLEIVRRLLRGARTSQELKEADQSGTTGRLYHHLRDLLACGIVVSHNRNSYAIAPEKAVSCLIIIVAASELASASGGSDEPSAQAEGEPESTARGKRRKEQVDER